MKKFISMILTVMLLLGAMAVHAAAEDESIPAVAGQVELEPEPEPGNVDWGDRLLGGLWESFKWAAAGIGTGVAAGASLLFFPILTPLVLLAGIVMPWFLPFILLFGVPFLLLGIPLAAAAELVAIFVVPPVSIAAFFVYVFGGISLLNIG